MPELIFRRVRRVLALIVCACAGAASANVEEQYTVTQTPDWVVPVAAASAHDGMDSIGGRRYLLVDRQHYDDGSNVALHQHRVVEVVGQAGLSSTSKLSISFDPSYQRLVLHSATVRRNGVAEERLPRARISVAHTETDSDNDLLYGDLTALVILPDVRVGDIVETRYTLYGRNPVFDKRHHSRWRMRWSVPIERNVLTITVPAEMPLTFTQLNDTRLTETLADGLRQHQWTADGVGESTAEDHTPGSYPDADILQVTAYRSWDEVAHWGAGLFRGHAASGPRYQKLARSLRQTRDTRGIDKAIAQAIDHVQKNIRYYGLELGENSHYPHSPDEVLSNGYGDCKDKALLLSALLGELDVESWPLLVSTRHRSGVADHLPSPSAFNHAILLIEHAGEQYWVDATDTSQMGLLGYRGQPEYGAGLVLGKRGSAMITRASALAMHPDIAAHDEFHFSSMGGPVDYTSTRVFRGREANRLRYWLDRSGRRGFHNDLEERIESMYGDLQRLDPLDIQRDELKNELTLRVSYRLNHFWDVNLRSGTAEFDAYAGTVYDALEEFEDVDNNRRAPLQIEGPLWIAHRIQFYPNMASPERALEESSFDMAGFAYHDAEYLLGDSLVFDSELKISTDTLKADDLAAYRQFVARVGRNANIGRYIRDIDRRAFRDGATIATLIDELEALKP